MTSRSRLVDEPCGHILRVLETARKNQVKFSWSEWASISCAQCNVHMTEKTWPKKYLDWWMQEN